MKKLHELSADDILAIIETRSGALLEADETAAVRDTALKAWEATQAVAYRDSGMSMTEAEKRVRASEDWAEMYLELQKANIEAAEAKRSYQRAVMAQDLWRTESATLRAIQ